MARHAADPSLGPADPALVIDEESYDPAAEGVSHADAPAPDAGAPGTAAFDAGDAEVAVAEAPFADAAGFETSIEAAAPGFGEHEAGDTTAAGAAEPAWLGEAAPEPEADLLAEAAPFAEHEAAGAAADDELIADAAPAARQAGRSVLRTEQEAPRQGSVADGFTDFRPVEAPQPTMAAAGNDLIDALPSLLPVFADLANTVDRPFGTMPEVMPPPPLRPILPPELQDEGPRPGLLARMLGRK